MDDEYDDDIADDDLVLAFSQAHELPDHEFEYTTLTGSRTVTHQVSPEWSAPSAKPTTKPPDAGAVLSGLPSDAFESSQELGPVKRPKLTRAPSVARSGASRSSQQVFRQTTLFGQEVHNEAVQASQRNCNRVFRADLPPEVPTHHSLRVEELRTWVYPTNLGPIRDYQFSIVQAGLFQNTLVALPTGLGKTFIAATEKVSQAEVALVFEVIPLMDKFTTMFGNMIDNPTLHNAVRHAANTGLSLLNKYYSNY